MGTTFHFFRKEDIMKLSLQVPPAEEPVTLDEVKSYLKLSSDGEDGYVKSLIASARSYVEGRTGRALLKQKWQMNLKPPYPPKSPLLQCREKRLEIQLPHPPLLDIESVTIKENDIPYRIEEDTVVLSPSYWNQEISIHYWAGYGETRESLPPDLKMAVLMVTRLFDDHQPIDLTILKPFKVFHLT